MLIERNTAGNCVMVEDFNLPHIGSGEQRE